MAQRKLRQRLFVQSHLVLNRRSALRPWDRGTDYEGLVVGHPFHLLPQAQWPHVRPYFLDVGQTFFPAAAFARIGPTGSVFPVSGPNRILFFVIHYDLVSRSVFLFIS